MPDLTWAYAAALASAQRTDCCGNDAWRGHFCSYHQGFQDGYDAALDAIEALDSADA